MAYMHAEMYLKVGLKICF